VISGKKKWAALGASALLGLAVFAPALPAQAAEGNATTGERVLVLKGATLKSGIKLQYRISVTSVENGIVKGVEQWRLCRGHVDACANNTKGGAGWIGTGPVVMTKLPWADSFAGFSGVGQVSGTFLPDGSMDIAYQLDVNKLLNKADRKTVRKNTYCNINTECVAQVT
jgi:hypothetical protein